MWVKKIPERYDFCGRPPCGLCFDWVEPNAAPVEGIVKMGRDILGKDEITPKERKQLEKAAERVHVVKKEMAQERERLAREYDETQAARMFQKQIGGAAKVREQSRARSPRAQNVLLDQIEMPPVEVVVTSEQQVTLPVSRRGYQETGRQRFGYNVARDIQEIQKEVVMSDGSRRWI